MGALLLRERLLTHFEDVFFPGGAYHGKYEKNKYVDKAEYRVDVISGLSSLVSDDISSKEESQKALAFLALGKSLQ